MKDADSTQFSFVTIVVLMIFMFVMGFVSTFKAKNQGYKSGQTDALYGKWKYAKVRDAAGNEYVVEVPEKK